MGGNAGSRPNSKVSRLYLAAYNATQTVGWSYLLYQLVTYYLKGSEHSLWNTVWWTVMVFQNAAVLEIFHAAAGLVPSSAVITTMQVFSRVFIVCCVLCVTKAAPAGSGLPLALLAWSVTEIIRYSYYFFALIKRVPRFLLYLRYTLFIVLYPIGITGELLCTYHAQEEVANTKLWTYALPNSYNFIFNYQYFLIVYMLLYIPSFPMLYGHMFSQRKKMLSDKPKKK